eukprot:12853-Heterococcus_DN1.PRE.1
MAHRLLLRTSSGATKACNRELRLSLRQWCCSDSASTTRAARSLVKHSARTSASRLKIATAATAAAAAAAVSKRSRDHKIHLKIDKPNLVAI